MVCVRRDSHAAIAFVFEAVVRGYKTCQRKPDNSRVSFLGSSCKRLRDMFPDLIIKSSLHHLVKNLDKSNLSPLKIFLIMYGCF